MVAAHFKVNVATVRFWRREGFLKPAMKLRSQWFFSIAEVQRFEPPAVVLKRALDQMRERSAEQPVAPGPPVLTAVAEPKP